jgi:hypothetical protein
VQLVTSGDVALPYHDAGAGEPVLFVHGAFIADAFRPLFSEPGARGPPTDRVSAPGLRRKRSGARVDDAR